jgi:hypothetical protein
MSRVRMLKNASNFVLGSKKPQRTPERTLPVFSSPAAALADIFEHPVSS